MKMTRFLFYFLFSSLVVRGEDWPRWRGVQGNGTWNGPAIARELNGSGLERVWKVQVYPGYSGVTVLGDQVLVMDRPPVKGGRETERALCVERQSGKKIWEFVYEAKYKKLDYDKGPRASLTIQDNRVYGLGSMGHAFCLDLRTGKQEWFRDLLKEENCPFPIWGFSASPEILGEVVLYHVGGGKGGNLLALNRKNGKRVWSVGDDAKAGYAQSVVLEMEDARQLLCWGPNKIMGLPIGGGAEFWSIPYELKYGVSIAKPIFEQGVVLVCGYWNGSRAIQISDQGKTARLLWSEEEKLRGLMAQPLYREGVVYLLDRSHGLTAFRLKTGEILWRDDHQLTAAGRNPHASIVWADQIKGEALSLNAEGELVYLNLNPDGYREYWREQVCGETWSHPAYAGNQIFARDDRSLSCWTLPRP